MNREIVPELGTGLGAREPDLMLRGRQVITARDMSKKERAFYRAGKEIKDE